MSATTADAPTTTAASDDTQAESTAATTVVTSAGGEGADSAYCILSAAGYVGGEALSDLNLPAEEFNRRSTEAALDEVDEMVAAAPDDLPVDIEVFAGLFREYAAALELVGWNLDNLDEAGNELDSELFDFLFELAVYDGEVCGVGDFADTGGDGSDDATDTTSVETTTADPGDLGDALTAEEIDLLMADPEERAFHLSLWTDIGLTEEQAECAARGVLALSDASDDAVDAVLAECGA